ncbi:MAG: Mrp/NBP35 family ATP-binding protein, partial [Planctomycetales bacterium]|nr:Mrp/NBP35 family ATP-binding protein [Planctomycetales bacterium]
IEEDQAVIWRGPLLHRTLTQFLQATDWGELDYLVIDMPPGTGDVALPLSQLLSLSGAVIVCTPQQVALLDAVKAVSMFNQVKIPVLGMVENMAGDIFGRGGARAKAEELEIPMLGELPADPEVRIRGDEGRISTLVASDSPVREELVAISQKVAIEVARHVTSGNQLPDLEIL